MSSHVGIGVVGCFSFEKEAVAEELRGQSASITADPNLFLDKESLGARRSYLAR
jgi:hypothetical protein